MAWEMARSEEDHLNEVELRATHHHHRQTTIRPKGQRCKMHEWEKIYMQCPLGTVTVGDHYIIVDR